MRFFPNYFDQVPRNAKHHDDTKDAKKQFTSVTGYHPAESHAGIFYELKVEPTGNEGSGLSVVESGFNPDLDPLVEDQHGKYSGKGFFHRAKITTQGARPCVA